MIGIAEAMARNGVIGPGTSGSACRAAPGVVPALMSGEVEAALGGHEHVVDGDVVAPRGRHAVHVPHVEDGGVGDREQEPAGVGRVRRVDGHAHRPVGVHHTGRVAPTTTEAVPALDRLGPPGRHRAARRHDVGLLGEDLVLHDLGVERQQQVVLHAERRDPARGRARLAERQHLVDEVHDAELEPAIAAGYEVVEHPGRVEPVDDLVVGLAGHLGCGRAVGDERHEGLHPLDERRRREGGQLSGAEALTEVGRAGRDDRVVHVR